MAEFIIGLDGGWSKSTGVLCDIDGHVLATARASGSAVAGTPSAEVLGRLNDLVNELCHKGGVPRSHTIHFGLGLNGVDYVDEVPGQHAILCGALNIGSEQLSLVNDGITALWGTSPERRLALVQHGSGLTTSYRVQPGQETIFDSLDVAGIFDVRRESLRATARMLDGRLNRTLLADRIVAHCGLTDNRFAECVHRGGKIRELFFTLAPVVFQAWADGDPVADEMASRAADDYALAVFAIAKRLAPAPFYAAFAGGVIQAGGPRLLERIGERLTTKCPEARLVNVLLPPECGAVVMVAHKLHLEIAKVFEQLRYGSQAAAA